VPMDQPDEKDTKPKRRNPFWRLGRRVKRKQDQEEAEKDAESEKDETKNAQTKPAAKSGAE
jgi:hypothetical protein